MEDLSVLIAKRFIQRRDAKARQGTNGEYYLHTTDGKRESPRVPWKMADIRDHLNGKVTYGHYLLDSESKCRLFAFDIDLMDQGWIPTEVDEEGGPAKYIEASPRAIWQNRKHPGRPWMKYQFRTLAEKIAAVASKDLELPVAVAYSGCKGLHVYCFHEPMDAEKSRKGAELVLETLGEFELFRGSNFYRHSDQDCYTGYPNLSVEVFPKQTSLEGKDLGNLMRLPLGRNLKTTDPTFFVDCTRRPNELLPTDAIRALTTGNPWMKDE
jgi:hypothetical protein